MPFTSCNVKTMGKRTKYKTRANGYKETMRKYSHFGTADFSGIKHFYGKDDDEIDAKIEAFEKSLNAAPEVISRKISEIADEWWTEKEKHISLNSVTSYAAKVKEIIEEFGSVPVTDLTVQMIFKWLTKKAAQG